jgi:hypothetical protein
MGLEFKIVNSERKELDKVVCDRCDAEIKKHAEGQWNQFGEPYSLYHEPSFDNFFLLKQSWGYGSQKDGETHRAVLCEPCYDEVFKDVHIEISHDAFL